MSEQLSPKEILKRQKHQHDFTMYQLGFVKYLEDTVDYGNKTFKNFSAVCLPNDTHNISTVREFLSKIHIKQFFKIYRYPILANSWKQFLILASFFNRIQTW